jgi:general secretion pathway protein L
MDQVTTITRVMQQLRALGGWWCGELSSFVPAPVRRRVIGSRALVSLEMLDTECAVRLMRGDRTTSIGTVPLSADLGTALKALLTSTGLRAAPGTLKVALLLPPTQVMTGTATLPAAAAGNLREVLAYECERLTAFPSHELLFDCDVLSQHPGSSTIRVRLVAARRALVEPVVESLTRAGLRLEAVGALIEAGQAPLKYDLLAADAKAGRSPLRLVVDAALLASCIGLAIALVIVPLQRKRDLADRLAMETRLLLAQADEVAQLEQEADALILGGRLGLDDKIERVLVTELLDVLSRELPDDTWLFRMRIMKAELEVSGFSTSASTLIEALDNLPILENVRFAAPVVYDSSFGRERFIIRADLSPAGDLAAP